MKPTLNNKVVFRVSGRNIARFISRCAKSGIKLESVSYIPHEALPAADVCISVKYAKKLCETASACNLKINTKKRTGIGFFLYKNRSRRILGFGLMLAVIVITIISHFIMEIEIVGNNRLTDADMSELLEKVGVHMFMKADKAVLNEKAAMLESLSPDIARASITVKGIKATVKIQETLDAPAPTHDNSFRNLYARCDGVIVSVLAYTGRATVKAGDIVKKGDILISGDLSTENAEVHVHARGRVFANVGHSFCASAGPYITKPVRSGKHVRRSVVDLFGFKFIDSPYLDYELVLSDSTQNTNFIPLSYTEAEVYELVNGKVKASDDELFTAAEQTAYAAMTRSLDKDATVISKSTTRAKNSDGSVTVTINVVTSEDIILYD